MYARLQDWAITSGRSLRPNRLRLAYIGGSLVDAHARRSRKSCSACSCTTATASPNRRRRRRARSAIRRRTTSPPAGRSPASRSCCATAAARPFRPARRGEVWIRGPNVMKGYFRDPQQTRAALDDDGWLHTGDIGEFGPDGDLAIVGRIKEMIIRGGFNVYPAEVERAIAAYPGVAQCAVVGRTRRRRRGGRRVRRAADRRAHRRRRAAAVPARSARSLQAAERRRLHGAPAGVAAPASC